MVYDNFSQNVNFIIHKYCNYQISMLLWNRKEEMDTQTTRKVILSFEILAGGYLAETGSLQNLTYLFYERMWVFIEEITWQELFWNLASKCIGEVQ